MTARGKEPEATLTVVGDVHRWWRPADATFLERSRPDLALFVGDLGDEDVPIVRAVASLPVPKAVILGNHDAWQSFGRKTATDKLRESLDVLGEDHVAYAVREVPRAGISLVGARPFSWGGQSLRSPELYDEIYGIHTMRQSAAAIVDAARNAQHRDLVILAHNGPLGLGDRTHDIFGKDFGKPGGDWGDRDLALAMQRIEGFGLRVRAVIAGHMHHRLVHPRGGRRTRFVRRGQTLFLNAAYVPRVRQDDNGDELSYFLRTRWQGGECTAVEEVWVDVHGDEREVHTPAFVDLGDDAPALDEGQETGELQD
ncbi:MAG: TIGR04168 family protein [Planctomycetes bacterium]|nr:TIGR04168 family protein [Planctomycetota bacterium]